MSTIYLKQEYLKKLEPIFEKIDPLQLQNRHAETIIYRLRTGHTLLHDSGLCDYCSEKESVKHF